MSKMVILFWMMLNIFRIKVDLSMLTRSKLFTWGICLFTYVGTVGQVALVDDRMTNTILLKRNVALVRVIKEYNLQVHDVLLSDMINLEANRLINCLQASSMQNIPMEKIRKFKLPVVDKEEQQRVVAILE